MQDDKPAASLWEWLGEQVDADEAAARDWQESYSPQFPSLCDSARVLAEVDATRRLLRRHHPVDYPPWGVVCQGCGVEGPNDHPRNLIDECPELCDRAAVYATRPGYGEGWRPDAA